MLVIVGYLKTAEGRAALDRAVEEAALRGAKLVVTHTDTGHGADEITSEREDLDLVRERLVAEGLDHEVRELARGNSPAEDLLDVAEEMDADLIVLGIRQRSPVGKLILGSNAQDVILNATCPVLCVRPTE